MYCSNCGAQMEEKDVFFAGCGAKNEEVVVDCKKKYVAWAVIAIIAVVAAVAIIIGTSVKGPAYDLYKAAKKTLGKESFTIEFEYDDGENIESILQVQYDLKERELMLGEHQNVLNEHDGLPVPYRAENAQKFLSLIGGEGEKGVCKPRFQRLGLVGVRRPAHAGVEREDFFLVVDGIVFDYVVHKRSSHPFKTQITSTLEG